MKCHHHWFGEFEELKNFDELQNRWKSVGNYSETISILFTVSKCVYAKFSTLMLESFWNFWFFFQC